MLVRIGDRFGMKDGKKERRVRVECADGDPHDAAGGDAVRIRSGERDGIGHTQDGSVADPVSCWLCLTSIP